MVGQKRMRKDIRIRISSGNLVPLLLKLELEQRPGALARHRRPDDRVLLGRQTLWRQRDGPPRDRDREPLAARRGPWTGSSTDARLDPGASQTRSGVPREREGSGARPQPSSGESSERERSSDRSGRERSSFWALNFVSASERGGRFWMDKRLPAATLPHAISALVASYTSIRRKCISNSSADLPRFAGRGRDFRLDFRVNFGNDFALARRRIFPRMSRMRSRGSRIGGISKTNRKR